MSEPPVLNADDAVQRLCVASGAPYRLVRRLAGGETGAHEVEGPDGGRLVCKWERDPSRQAARRSGVALTQRLQTEAGWPVPDQYIVEGAGETFVLQTLEAGAPIDVMTHHLVDQLLELHQRRLGLVRAGDETGWTEQLFATLTVGGEGYCLHEPLREFDRRTANLVHRIEAASRDLDASEFPAADIVHWDFHHGNLLQVDGELSAIVDNDFVTVADAAFDLVALAMASIPLPREPGVQTRLFSAAFAGLDDTRRNAYVGHLLIRNLDWAIRKARTSAVEFWLDQAGRLLV